MRDTIIYTHNFEDYSVELELELDVYIPRHPDIDDVPEAEILSATVIEETGDYLTGQEFDINLLDNEQVMDVYLNQ